jgi:hypothetical protein
MEWVKGIAPWSRSGIKWFKIEKARARCAERSNPVLPNRVEHSIGGAKLWRGGGGQMAHLAGRQILHDHSRNPCIFGAAFLALASLVTCYAEGMESRNT